MELKHPDKIQIYKDYELEYNSTVCLADICPIFGCQIFIKSAKFADNGAAVFDMSSGQKVISFSDVHVCNDDDVKQAKQECREIMNE